jgi:hypothetical protein
MQILMTLCLSFLFAFPVNARNFSADSGLMINAWRDNHSDTGIQTFIPVTLEASVKDFEFSLLNALVYTHVDQSGADSATLTHILDTKLNGTYRIEDKLPVDMLFGLGLNIPTGKTDLPQSDMVLLTIPDLMPITTYGEGFNVNPYLALSKEWDKWVAGLGAGYLWQGEYNFSDQLQKYDPGDIITFTAKGGYMINDNWQANLFLEYAIYGKDKQDGNEFYKEGNMFAVSVNCVYSKPSYEVDLDLGLITHEKSEFSGDEGFAPEPRNSHGQEYDASGFYKYFVNSKTSLIGGLAFMYLGANSYSEDSPYYIGSRTKFEISGGVEMKHSDNLKWNVSLGLFNLIDDKNINHPDQKNNYYGLNAGLSGRYAF